MKAHSLVSAGLYKTVADAIVGSSRALNMTANGTTQTTATILTGGINVVSTTGVSGASVLVNEGAARITVCNIGANPLAVFPPVGGSMNGVLNASVLVPVGKVAQLLTINGPDWYAIVSA